MGTYLLISLFFVVAAMIEFAIVLILKRLWQHQEDTESRVRTNLRNEIVLTTKDDNAPTWMSKQGQVRCGFRVAKKKWIDFNLSTNKIDIAAFVLCPTVYFFFNCIYWMHYYRF